VNDGPVVEMNDVTRLYELRGETVRALDGVTLRVERGDFLAVAGPSGSGKSTLLHLVGALDTPTRGTIRVHGHELARMSGAELARLRRDHIGFIFQAYNLIPVLTALENVEYVMLLQGVETAERRRKALEILGEVGLSGMENRRPTELSGGQQQRVAVARAIVSEPTLVLADEPTANLDTTTGGGLLDAMEHMNRVHGTTFVFSTHDPRVMERALRLVHLRDGRVERDERR
jgi:putative ABC transport system ATP-binding protein